MSLGDHFSSEAEMRARAPGLALLVSLWFCANADGSLEESEARKIFKATGGDTAVRDAAVTIYQTMPLEDFLSEIGGLLETRQNHGILVRMIELAFADGRYHPDEHDVLKRFAKAFEIPQPRFEAYVTTLALLRDKRLFQI